MAKKYEGTDKKVSKMTREGLTEENLRDGSVSDISSKSRDRPIVKSAVSGTAILRAHLMKITVWMMIWCCI